MMLLLLIVDELIKLCFECCFVMLLMMIHAMGIAICVVVIKSVVFCWFLVKMGHK